MLLRRHPLLSSATKTGAGLRGVQCDVDAPAQIVEYQPSVPTIIPPRLIAAPGRLTSHRIGERFSVS